jgi:AraC-like DNA-binding protein
MKLIECGFRPLTKSSVPGHAHQSIEWHYVIAGRCGFDIGSRRLEIATGDLFAVEPGAVHGVRIRRPDDWLLQYTMHASSESAEDDELWQHWKKQAGKKEVITIGTARHALFARLSNELRSRDQWRQRAASLRFTALLCDCIAREAPIDDTHPHVQKCLRLMHQSLYEILSIDALSTAVGLNKSYLIRLFKQHIGQAPLQYFNDMKTQLAARLLRDGEVSVQEVSERIGYQAAAHFSRSFKRWSGLSPATYARSRHTA